MQHTFQYWIATKRLEIDQDNLQMKFSALNVDFSRLSPDFLGSRRPAQEGVKHSCPPILPQLSHVAWKRLQIGTDMLLFITSNSYGLFRFINIDDLERPWTSKEGYLVNFSQFLTTAHISRVNCNEMPKDKPRQPAYEIFSIKRRF